MLAGHSLGAITELALAARYPALARALVLEDPPATAVAADPALAEGIAQDAALGNADPRRARAAGTGSQPTLA